MVAPFFGPETRAIFHKGREHVEELAESAALWHHDVVIHKSDTDPNGVLIELTKLSLKNR
jgi:16S rRNA (guanine527-N7)-methyltransferase